jgi:hypothetical protein
MAGLQGVRLGLLCLFFAFGDCQEANFPPSDDLEFPHPVLSDDTCGTPPEMYFDPQDNVNKTCNASDVSGPTAHPPGNIIDNDPDTWWQSKKGVQTVQFEMNLTQTFEVTFFLFAFGNSYRPRGISIEKSIDYGVNYDPLEYIVLSPATDCQELFGVDAKEFYPPGSNDPQIVLCREFFGDPQATSGDSLTVRLLRDPADQERPGQDPLTPELLEFRRANYIRVTMKGFQQIANDSNADFFTVAELKVNGRCVCNGHGVDCMIDPDLGNYTCGCADNTCGSRCERCCPLFNQQPYEVAVASVFVCEECECNGQALSCTYNSMVADQMLSINKQGNSSGGGVCDCLYGAIGINCGECGVLTFLPEGSMLSNTTMCEPCNCSEQGTRNVSGVVFLDCLRNATDGMGIGDCYCNDRFDGAKCNMCRDGLFNVSAGCVNCTCDPLGSIDNNCNKTTGVCNCKPNNIGRDCDVCDTNYTGPGCVQCAEGFTLNGMGGGNCIACQCNGHSNMCNNVTGDCINCIHNTTGDRCQFCKDTFFGDATNGMANDCQPCACSDVGATNNSCKSDGNCFCKMGVTGDKCDVCETGFFNLTEFGCEDCMCNVNGSVNASCSTLTGECFCKMGVVGRKCDMCDAFHFNFTDAGCERCNDVCIRQLEEEISDAEMLLTNAIWKVGNKTEALDGVEILLSMLSDDTNIEKNTVAALLMVLSTLESDIKELEDEVASLLDRTCHLLDKVKNLKLRAETSYNQTKERLPEVTSLSDEANATLVLVQGVVTHIKYVLMVIQARRMEAQNLVDMANSTLRNFTRDYSAEETEINKIKEMADATLAVATAMYLNATNFTSDLVDFEASLNDLEQLRKDVEDEAALAVSIAEAAKQIALQAEAILDDVDVLDGMIAATLKEAEELINMTVDKNNKAMDLLNMVIATFMNANATFSGSGGISYRLMKLKADFETFLMDLSAVEMRVNQSVEHAYNLSMHAMEMDEIFNPSRERGSKAVGVVKRYRDVRDIIMKAVNRSEEAQMVVDKTLEHVRNLSEEGLAEKAQMAKENSEMVLTEAKKINKTAHDLVIVKEDAQQSVNLAHVYVMHAQEANMNVSKAIDRLPAIDPTLVVDIKNNTQCILENVASCESLHFSIESRLTDQRNILDHAELIAENANQTFHDAMTTLDNATQEFNNRLDEVADIKSVQNETRTLRETVKGEIWRIREKLNRVKRLSSNCQRRLLFDDDSAPVQSMLGNETDDGLKASPKFTMASFYFLSQNDSGRLLYIGEHVNESLSAMYFFAVELHARRVWFKFSTGNSDGAVLMHHEEIQIGEWYHVYATRFVLSLFSSLYWF